MAEPVKQVVTSYEGYTRRNVEAITHFLTLNKGWRVASMSSFGHIARTDTSTIIVCYENDSLNPTASIGVTQPPFFSE